MKKTVNALVAICSLLISSVAFSDDYGSNNSGAYYTKDWKAEYRDGPCRVKEESKPYEYKVEIKCEGGYGAHWIGEWKDEYWDGPCKVKKDVKFDKYKEEVKCKHGDDDDDD